MFGVLDLLPVFSRLRRLENNSARPLVPTTKQATTDYYSPILYQLTK